MRFTLAVLALAASSVSASIIARQIPSCANSCLFGDNVDLDGCGPTDNVCLCNSKTFVSKSTTCIMGACSGEDLETALNVSQQICLSVGVTLASEPAASTDASTPAQSSTSSSASSSASVTSSSTSSKATSTSPSSSTPTSATGSNTAAPAAQTGNSANANSINAFAGLAAIGFVALAL